MLLFFAQFERDITGERIRDKVAGSKRKGIWMGGAVPVGYRVENRALHIVEEEAEFVRDLFRRYLELGSVIRLKAALDAEASVTPARVSQSGRPSGGRPFSRGHLYWILSNPIYIGRLRHKGQVHEGLHAAIEEREVWEAIQERLKAQAVARRDPQPDLHSFLAGKIYDDRGNRMGATYACKGSKRFRYYVPRPALVGDPRLAGSLPRVSAPEIESAVIDAVQRHLASRPQTSGDRDRDLRASPSSRGQQPIVEMQTVIERVIVHACKIDIALREAYTRSRRS